MGGKSWQLEIFKMAVYMAFPVSCFYFFNRPEIFNKVNTVKQQIESTAHLDTSLNEDDMKALRKLRLERAMQQEIKWREEYAARKRN
ncbi:hypothetical protein EB796_021562 [Bugula neritina]|uniref:PET100 n=1 Tax=Bugula neritina TaxID=10212 RepID=A0A7J7J1S3_BUGNE|nr:hypothetical protein EB796_021562 [Bugula neritina]